MNKLTQHMIDAGATALCGLTREQAKDPLTMKRFNDGCERAQWLWTLMTAAAPKGNSDEPTLREYFAAHCPMSFDEAQMYNATGENSMAFFAKMRFEYADSMIAECVQ